VTYEVRPRRLGGARGRRPAALVALALVAVAGWAVLASPAVEAPNPFREGAAGLDGQPSAPRATAPAQQHGEPAGAEAADVAGPPRRRVCHDVAVATCHGAVNAAVGALPADLPRIASADVWTSLVCGDTLDCPPARLRDARPVASVALAFADEGPAAWVNVVARRDGGSADRLSAWLVRWR
jgi:hypothetical protein